MIHAILDEGVPADFKDLFKDSEMDVVAFPDDWRSRSDGEIFRLAISAGYDWLITCDKQMPFQQNLTDRQLCVMVLPTPKMLDLEPVHIAIEAMLRQPVPGNFIVVDATGSPAGKPVPHIVGRTYKSS